MGRAVAATAAAAAFVLAFTLVEEMLDFSIHIVYTASRQAIQGGQINQVSKMFASQTSNPLETGGYIALSFVHAALYAL